MAEFNKGDEVEISFRGRITTVVQAYGVRPQRLVLARPNGRQTTVTLRDGVDVKVIDPSYVHGGIYRDADGDFFQYDGDYRTWDEFGVSGSRNFDYPARPLVRIDTPREDEDDD